MLDKKVAILEIVSSLTVFSKSFEYLNASSWTLSNNPASAFLYFATSTSNLKTTTLSMFVINIISDSIVLRFSIKAPCPAGLNTTLPFSFLKGSKSLVIAIVSVDSIWKEKSILNFNF